MNEGRNLYRKVTQQISAKQTQIQKDFLAKAAPIQKQIDELEKILEPFKKEAKKRMVSLEKEKKLLFTKEFKELCGEHYKIFSKFIEKVKAMELKDYKEEIDEEKRAWYKKASPEEFLFDVFENRELDNEEIEKIVKTLPPKKQKEVVFIVWKLQHT